MASMITSGDQVTRQAPAVVLRPKCLSDATLDYVWSSDRELMTLDASEITRLTFTEYVAQYAREMSRTDASRLRFAIETAEGRHIGNCSCYNVDGPAGEAEIGILIGDRDHWNKGCGTSAIRQLIAKAFGEMGLRHLRLRTLRANTRAQRCFRKCGFSVSGHSIQRGHDFLIMQTCRQEWLQLEAGRNQLEKTGRLHVQPASSVEHVPGDP